MFRVFLVKWEFQNCLFVLFRIYLSWHAYLSNMKWCLSGSRSVQTLVLTNNLIIVLYKRILVCVLFYNLYFTPKTNILLSLGIVYVSGVIYKWVLSFDFFWLWRIIGLQIFESTVFESAFKIVISQSYQKITKSYFELFFFFCAWARDMYFGI